jgi:regulator of sirC expression with transglutaminase-like and TPR domain
MNPIFRPLRIALFAICLLSAACSRETRKPVLAFPLLADSISLEQSCISLSGYLAAVLENADTNSLGSFYRTIDSSADRLGRSLGAAHASPAAADSIVALVYHQWNIGFDQRDSIPATLLPHLVYKNRRGACLGTGLIILILSERIGCPLYGVALPGHFFLRYASGATHFNIEPNRDGFSHPDQYYREKYSVVRSPWYTLSNLTKAQTVGMLCYNAGVLCLRDHRFASAMALFAEALKALKGFPEARGNLALAYSQTGRTDLALSILEGLFKEYPAMPSLAANYGYLCLASGRYKNAADIFATGLASYPGDSILLRGRAQACAHADCSSGKAH